MLAALRSEMRKLLTIRSTYVITGIAALLVGFFAFYATGWRANKATMLDPNLLQNQAEQAVLMVGLLGAIVGILLVTHEYRYNTIVYTLTSASSRTKVFLAKLLAITVFSFAFTVIMCLLSPVLTVLGISAHGGSMGPQHLELVPLFWKVLFVGWGYSMVSFIFAMIVRVQVGAISLLFLMPAMIEPLIGLVLKKNAVYLPYNSLQSVISPAVGVKQISELAAFGVVCIYVVAGLVIAWQTFLYRDANQ